MLGDIGSSIASTYNIGGDRPPLCPKSPPLTSLYLLQMSEKLLAVA